MADWGLVAQHGLIATSEKYLADCVVMWTTSLREPKTKYCLCCFIYKCSPVPSGTRPLNNGHSVMFFVDFSELSLFYIRCDCLTKIYSVVKTKIYFLSSCCLKCPVDEREFCSQITHCTGRRNGRNIHKNISHDILQAVLCNYLSWEITHLTTFFPVLPDLFTTLGRQHNIGQN